MKPYYQDDRVTLYHGDCREIDEWESAHVLVTDPPYGIDWGVPERKGRKAIVAIANDLDTAARDYVIGQWGHIRPAIVFGSPILPVPMGTKQTLVWEKTLDAGVLGTVAGFRRNWEAIYLLGNFPQCPATDSSVIKSSLSTTHGARNIGHAHAKPVPLMERLLGKCPAGLVADPFAGSGSTLVAARNLGRKAVGVELEERYCEIIAKRLDQMCLEFG
jgi:DNA modification methylase